jgi:hypothetical protein
MSTTATSVITPCLDWGQMSPLTTPRIRFDYRNPVWRHAHNIAVFFVQCVPVMHEITNVQLIVLWEEGRRSQFRTWEFGERVEKDVVEGTAEAVDNILTKLSVRHASGSPHESILPRPEGNRQSATLEPLGRSFLRPLVGLLMEKSALTVSRCAVI